MSTSVGGSIDALSLKGRLFPVAADADVERQVGGFVNEVQANGNGSARLVKKRQPWKLGGIEVDVNEDRGDHKFLQDLADSKEFFPIAITLASGFTWHGKGQIVEEITFSTEKSTAELTLMGPKKLEQQ